MTYQKKDNSGALFNNDRKQNQNHPDKTGNITVAGVEYYISGWIKQGQKGSFLSLSVKPKEAAKPQGYGAGSRIENPSYPNRQKVPYTPQDDSVW